jgi:hypothetical protein
MFAQPSGDQDLGLGEDGARPSIVEALERPLVQDATHLAKPSQMGW